MAKLPTSVDFVIEKTLEKLKELEKESNIPIDSFEITTWVKHEKFVPRYMITFKLHPLEVDYSREKRQKDVHWIKRKKWKRKIKKRRKLRIKNEKIQTK